MIELPEALTMARQINDTICGKRVAVVVAGHTPHKLAWYYGDRQKYADLLVGRNIEKAHALGSLVEIKADAANILLGEGVAIRFHGKNEPRPARHQLLIEFEDQSALSGSVQMYGGMGCFSEGEMDNPYYLVAKKKPSPLSPAFDRGYFQGVISAPETQRLSLKALLATEQRIPGLGNGVLQDILFNASMHPRKKLNTLSLADRDVLFNAIVGTLTAMASQGGRDTELDLFGSPGRYKTVLSKNTVGRPCPRCGTIIGKEAYMGGSIYFCGRCQTP
jgi:formamidopyrimidine-DNA glycosylase